MANANKLNSAMASDDHSSRSNGLCYWYAGEIFIRAFQQARAIMDAEEADEIFVSDSARLHVEKPSQGSYLKLLDLGSPGLLQSLRGLS